MASRRLGVRSPSAPFSAGNSDKAAPQRRVGLVDLDLDNFHANTFLKLFREDLKDRGFAVTGCTASDRAGGQAWARAHDVPWFDDAAAMGEHVDGLMILAPSNPEAHLDMCRQVFPLGKPTYVDKTFAPDLATAEAIFALADRHRTPVQTTSVLRYTDVQAYVKEVGRDKVRHLCAFAAGRSFEEYGIHPVEMVISCMGTDVRQVQRRDVGRLVQLLIDFDDCRSATVNLHLNTATDYAAMVTTDQASRFITVDGGRLFHDGAIGILDFLTTGQPNIDRAQSLAVRRVLDEAAG